MRPRRRRTAIMVRPIPTIRIPIRTLTMATRLTTVDRRLVLASDLAAGAVGVDHGVRSLTNVRFAPEAVTHTVASAPAWLAR